jgi:CarboxypepD_reg-like domain
LSGAAAGRTCGRFAAGQLERPLQRAAPVAPAARWRAWLAAAVSVWAVREGMGTEAKAQTATEWRARYWGGPVPAAPPAETPATPAAIVPLAARKPLVTAAPPPVEKHFIMGGAISAVSEATRHPAAAVAPFQLRGVVTDSSSGEGLPGVTVLLKGTQIGVSTTATGSYELALPAELTESPVVSLVISSVGYLAQERTLPTRAADEMQNFRLKADNRMLGEIIYQLSPGKLPPAPWHPRAFYSWGKYWLTRPFRHN